MPRLLNNRTIMEFDDGTRVAVPASAESIRCPKCGTQIPIREKSTGCLLTWLVILLAIITLWFVFGL